MFYLYKSFKNFLQYLNKLKNLVTDDWISILEKKMYRNFNSIIETPTNKSKDVERDILI